MIAGRHIPRLMRAAEAGGGGGDPLVWDWEALAAPISDAAPSGPSLRYEGVYDQLIEARRYDDPSLPQGVWEIDLKRADWRKVSSVALDILQTRSKDLQIAAWLVDAQIRMRGFLGAADGLRLLNLLVTTFWDSLHPQLDDEDEDVQGARLAPLEWLADKAADVLRLVPISISTPKSPRVFSMADWGAAQNIERLAHRTPALLQQAARDGIANFAEIKLAALDLPMRTREQWFLALRSSIGEIGELSRALDERCGRRAPSFGKILEELHAIERFYLTLFPKLSETVMKAPDSRATRSRAGEPDTTTTPESAKPGPSVTESLTSRDALSGILEVSSAAHGIASREEAFALLEAVAQYLMRTEPHSPVPYLVQRAVAWGEMSFGQLLAQFIHDPAELERLYGFLGIHERGLEDME